MGISDLFKPKWKHSDHSVRKKAVSELKDPEVLADIGRHDQNEMVRKAAVSNIVDQDLLVEIIKNEKSSVVRIDILRKLNSAKWQDLFIEIIKTDTDDMLRLAAIKKIDPEKHRELLIVLAGDQNNWSIQKEAIKNLAKTNALFVTPLIKHLRDSSSVKRQRALKLLKEIGWQPETVEDKSLFYTMNGDFEKCIALGGKAVGSLLLIYKYKITELYCGAADGLKKIGKPAIKPLIDMLDHENVTIRDRMKEILM